MKFEPYCEIDDWVMWHFAEKRTARRKKIKEMMVVVSYVAMFIFAVYLANVADSFIGL